MTAIPPVINTPPSFTDSNQAPTNDLAPRTSAATRTKRGVANIHTLWPQNKTITIAFMDTPKEAAKIIKKAINSYAPFINLKLKFVKGNEADIRISTPADKVGSWSHLGTNALKVPKHKPTMQINIRHTVISTIQRDTLHEFGHALGLEHEHQHPDRTFSFNKEGIYKTFTTDLHTPKQIYDNIIHPLDPQDLKTSAYDQKSIMHYAFNAASTSNNVEIPPNYRLTEGDKEFIKSLYPPAARQKKPIADKLLAIRIFLKKL